MLRDPRIICELWCCKDSSFLDAMLRYSASGYRWDRQAVRDVEDEGSRLLANIRLYLVDKAALSPEDPTSHHTGELHMFSNKN
jgi:hypothetical protein